MGKVISTVVYQEVLKKNFWGEAEREGGGREGGGRGRVLFWGVGVDLRLLGHSSWVAEATGQTSAG